MDALMWLHAETLKRVLSPHFEEPESCSAHMGTLS